MAAPILWAPGIFWFFLLKNPHAHKIPPLRGGFWVFLEGGGGSANFIVMGAGIFPKHLEFLYVFLSGVVCHYYGGALVISVKEQRRHRAEKQSF